MNNPAVMQIVLKAVDEATGVLTGIGGKAASVFGSMAKVAVAASATAITAAAGFAAASAVKFAEAGDAVEKMGRRTGIAAESISALALAADMAGTSIDAVETGVKLMQKSVAALAEGNKGAVAAFGDLGITLGDIKKLKPDEQFAKIGYAISEIPDPAKRTAAALEIFGRGGTDLLPLFQDLEEGMDGIKEKARAVGVLFDSDMAKAAAKLNDSLGLVKAAFKGAALQVGATLAPAIVDMVDKAMPKIAELQRWLAGVLPKAFNAVVDAARWLYDAVQRVWAVFEEIRAVEIIGNALRELWGTIQTHLMPAWRSLMEAVEANRPAFEKLAQFLAAVVVVAIVGLIGAINLAVQCIAVWIGWIEAAVTAWANAKANLQQVWDAIAAYAQKTWDGIVASVQNAIAAVMKPIDDFIAKVQKAISMASDLASKAKTAWTNLPANLGIGARAAGGAVAGGASYLVGERGAEIFTPQASGTILPSAAVGGTTINIAITGNTLLDRNAAEKIGDLIVSRLKLAAVL